MNNEHGTNKALPAKLNVLMHKVLSKARKSPRPTPRISSKPMISKPIIDKTRTTGVPLAPIYGGFAYPPAPPVESGRFKSSSRELGSSTAGKVERQRNARPVRNYAKQSAYVNFAQKTVIHPLHRMTINTWKAAT
ncbi:hypothetical protein FA13DRAFT_1720147 [Coprinellus micaceus]|uniref:Uncharacterized protein n=1 Tax=Coprinellus micaceus TaxID=71717 RepID=A0A4Y7SAX8_COPMI|nr:hypothetical protein FA13DRAFT_1720147 [Coprinellus micaceus]